MKLVQASLVIILLMIVTGTYKGKCVITVFAGKNVVDIGMLGVVLEVSVMMRNMRAVPVIISAMMRGHVKGFEAGHRIGI